ncbi:MAG TPA: FIST N-terminal domain-containing protein [Methylomirabilota bacterium]|nr:FIST N-terminal domain-containing protein [Methylomirabilota bacterium]
MATERLLAAAGAGLGLGPSPAAAAIDAALAAMASAGADHADLALVFTTGDAYPAAHELLHAVRRVTGARVVVGCSGAGVLTERREVEDEPAVAVLVVRDPRLVAKPVLVRDLADPADVGAELARQAGATLAEGGCLLVLADVAGLDPRALLDGARAELGFVPVVGGVAAGTPLFELVNTEVVQGSLAGVALSGPRSIIGVAQGCVPIGEPYVITRAEGNTVIQIAGRPPLEVLREAVRATPDGAARAQRAGLFAGLAMDSAKSPLERGDFLVRNLLGADAGTGAIAVAEPVRVGQTIQFQLRDAAASREDLATALREVARALKGQPPAFGCYFNCAGRGRGLFDVPDHDVSLIRAHLGEFPLVGFFGNGEFAPIGRRNFFHNYTGALVVFPA